MLFRQRLDCQIENICPYLVIVILQGATKSQPSVQKPFFLCCHFDGRAEINKTKTIPIHKKNPIFTMTHSRYAKTDFLAMGDTYHIWLSGLVGPRLIPAML
jgi:hypothetical protein